MTEVPLEESEHPQPQAQIVYSWDDPSHRAIIEEDGVVGVKKPFPVYLLEQDKPFMVYTNEGPLSGKPGDYVAYDEISGHIWPVSREYVETHYDIQEG